MVSEMVMLLKVGKWLLVFYIVLSKYKRIMGRKGYDIEIVIKRKLWKC